MLRIYAVAAEAEGDIVRQPLLGGDLFESMHQAKTLSQCLYFYDQAVARARQLNPAEAVAYWIKQYKGVLPPQKDYGVRVHGYWVSGATRNELGVLIPRMRKPNGFDSISPRMREFVNLSPKS